MTRLLLHTIVSAGDADPGRHRDGLREQPLRWIEVNPLGGWATVWGDADSQLRREDLFEHHRIVEWVWREGACLPVRFPTWLTDEGAFRGLVAARENDFRAALERVRGQAELAVTVLWAEADPAYGRRGGPAGPPCIPHRNIGRTRGAAPTGESRAQIAGPTSPGRRYLEARREEQAVRDLRRETAQRFADALDEELRPLVTASEHRVSPAARVALSSALLASRERESEMRERIVRVSGRWEGTRTLVNGPWPPYSFAGVET